MNKGAKKITEHLVDVFGMKQERAAEFADHITRKVGSLNSLKLYLSKSATGILAKGTRLDRSGQKRDVQITISGGADGKFRAHIKVDGRRMSALQFHADFVGN